MNILVIGLGSMGKRRIRLLKKMYQQYHIYGVDLNAQRCAFVKKEYEMKHFRRLKKLFRKENLNVHLYVHRH